MTAAAVQTEVAMAEMHRSVIIGDRLWRGEAAGGCVTNSLPGALRVDIASSGLGRSSKLSRLFFRRRVHSRAQDTVQYCVGGYGAKGSRVVLAPRGLLRGDVIDVV